MNVYSYFNNYLKVLRQKIRRIHCSTSIIHLKVITLIMKPNASYFERLISAGRQTYGQRLEFYNNLNKIQMISLKTQSTLSIKIKVLKKTFSNRNNSMSMDFIYI